MKYWGYKEMKAPEGCEARPNGCVLEHRLVAEKKLGRKLKKSEAVHHIDGNRGNNEEDNIMVFVTVADHARFHKNGIAQKAENGAYTSPEPEPIFCADCGKRCFGKRCFECSYIDRRKVARPSKEELAEMMQSMPIVRIGKKYGVSDNAVRKWAKSYGLEHRKRKINKG